MERNSNSNNAIKLSILDIFPSYEEINPKKEEMFAIFQGLNNFFDLEEILTRNKTKIIEIENNNQSSIIISLIKSNNIIATGFINIKHGEQWITLNYETKNRKISSSLALNLMDCIKLKIFCDLKNKSQANTTFNNININNSGLNINANINYTNRNNNKGTNNIINQINLKISKRNINNKILLKGSPMKTNYDRTSNKRSPNKDINDFNTYKMASNEDIINNNLIKSNNNFNTYNYMNVNINMNPYTTISKCSIKKIDLNSSNKTRNSKIAQKKGSHADYTSLRTSNNNFRIKKMNTSTCSLNTVNKNKNKKSRLTPDLEVKGIKNTKVGCSPGPSLKNKNNLDDNLYNKSDNTEKANDKTFHCSTKIKNFRLKETNKKDNKKEENNMNSKEYIKLKTVLISSFILEKKKVQENKDKKNNKENENEYIVVDKNEQECEEMLNNAYKKGKCSEINKYKDELNLKKKVKRFHLFNYNCEDPKESKIIYKLGKVLVFTYRKNFPKITSYKTKKTFTTDAWWGCMVRCGQMILSRGIYRILKSTGMNTKSAIYFTTSLFNNYPIQTKFLHQYFRGMITKYKSLSNFDEKGAMEIKEFFPPFSIRTICDVGELFERTAGEWFSDVIITGVFKKISEFFELFQDPKLNVKVMKYQSCIEIPDILEKCFVQKKYNKKDNNYIHFNKKYYYFDKMGIIFVNVRVGLDKIPKQYFEGIKELFTLKECIGIIGGKSRLAYYFIGYNNDDDSLLYLDPHVSKEAHKKFLFNNILDKHVNKEIHQLKMSKMSTAFTIGFCFRNYAEFLKLYEFWQTAKQKDLPILGMVKQNLVLVEKYKEKEEDYLPTYEDKDEDDF